MISHTASTMKSQIQIGNQLYFLSSQPSTPKKKVELPPEKQSLFVELRDAAHKNPKKTLPSLLLLAKEHPLSAEISNLLCFVYLQLKKERKAEKLIAQNYRNHPDDLLARINFADQLLRKKEPYKVAALFCHTFNLKELYPDQDSFSHSELLGFALLMSYYHEQIGKREEALDYYRAAVQLNPQAKSLDYLEKRLFAEPRLLRWKRSLHNFLRFFTMTKP